MDRPPLTWSRLFRQDARLLLCRLLRTASPSGDEGEIGHLLRDWFQKMGVPVRMQRVRRNTANVIAHVGTGLPQLLLVTHLDTVVPDASHWRVTQPHQPLVRGGRVYGVGACDAKGIVVAFALALLHLRDTVGRQRRGSVLGGFVVEEETAGTGSQLLASSLTDVRDTMAVVGEPTGLRRVSLGSRGNAFVKLTVEGSERHGAYAADNADPLRVMPALAKWTSEVRRRYSDHSFVPSVSITSLAAGVDALQGRLHVRSPNTAPGSLEMTLDIRTSPILEDGGFRLLRQELQALARSLAPLKISVTFVVPPIPGQSIDASHPLVQATCRSVQAVTGRKPALDVAVGANDATFFAQRGIPTLNEVGPGDDARIHRGDEFTTLDEVLRGAEMYALLAADVLGTSPSTP